LSKIPVASFPSLRYWRPAGRSASRLAGRPEGNRIRVWSQRRAISASMRELDRKSPAGVRVAIGCPAQLSSLVFRRPTRSRMYVARLIANRAHRWIWSQHDLNAAASVALSVLDPRSDLAVCTGRFPDDPKCRSIAARVQGARRSRRVLGPKSGRASKRGGISLALFS
jgi:hypothetical protein